MIGRVNVSTATITTTTITSITITSITTTPMVRDPIDGGMNECDLSKSCQLYDIEMDRVVVVTVWTIMSRNISW